MIKCSTSKKVYLTEALAEEALIGAHTAFDYRTGNGPIAIYHCADCGYYHLTSKGELNSNLAKHLKNGRIDRDKEATAWLNKLKYKRS